MTRPSPGLDRAIDWHVHTECSCDSDMHPLDACAAAQRLGLEGLCFVDHVDFDPRDEGYGYFDWDHYRRIIDEARQAYPQLLIFTGYELNWQRDFADALVRFVESRPVDFVLGSVHWVPSGFINHPETYRHVTFEQFAAAWSAEALDLLRQGCCDGFAHFDYFFLQAAQFPQLRRAEVFERFAPVAEALAASEVSLEINVSALRKGLDEPFPSWDFVRKYVEAGGRFLHMGSDSHRPEHLTSALDENRRRALDLRDRITSRENEQPDNRQSKSSGIDAFCAGTGEKNDD